MMAMSVLRLCCHCSLHVDLRLPFCNICFGIYQGVFTCWIHRIQDTTKNSLECDSIWPAVAPEQRAYGAQKCIKQSIKNTQRICYVILVRAHRNHRRRTPFLQ